MSMFSKEPKSPQVDRTNILNRTTRDKRVRNRSKGETVKRLNYTSAQNKHDLNHIVPSLKV